MYGVKAYHRMKPGSLIRALREADGLISGGGSLLQDATSSKTIPYYLAVLKIAQWLGKPTFIYSQGIGPVSRPMFYRLDSQRVPALRICVCPRYGVRGLVREDAAPAGAHYGRA